MKREIKFRGKRVDNGKFVEGDLIHGVNHNAGKMYILPIRGGVMALGHGLDPLDGYEVDPATVGQFFEQHDKDGKEIWEGDICNSKGGMNGTILFITDCPTITLGFYFKCSLFTSAITPSTGLILEVIGNVHDNPELTK